MIETIEKKVVVEQVEELRVAVCDNCKSSAEPVPMEDSGAKVVPDGWVALRVYGSFESSFGPSYLLCPDCFKLCGLEIEEAE